MKIYEFLKTCMKLVRDKCKVQKYIIYKKFDIIFCHKFLDHLGEAIFIITLYTTGT